MTPKERGQVEARLYRIEQFHHFGDCKALPHKPSDFFKSHEKVGEALLQSLEDNDAGAFLEILDTYLTINKTQIAKKAKLSRTTVQNALSHKGNPTIRTMAKIVHRAVA